MTNTAGTIFRGNKQTRIFKGVKIFNGGGAIYISDKSIY
jgi:hypothetical protein